MITVRTVTVLAAGTVAALAIGGVALGATVGDPANPSRSAAADTLSVPSPSASSDDNVVDSGLGSPRSADASPSSSASSSAPSSQAPSSLAPSSSASVPAAATTVTDAAARAIALRAAGGGQVTKVERETEHGRAVWDVEVVNGGTEHEIDVDRATGAVLRHERDDADGDDRGDDADDRDDDDRAHDDRGHHGRGDDHDDDRDDDHGSDD